MSPEHSEVLVDFPDSVDWDAQNATSYRQVCDELDAQVFASFERSGDVEFSPLRSTPFNVGCYILKPETIRPRVVQGWLRPIQAVLRGSEEYWQVRLFLPPLSESENGPFLLWLTVDRYQVIPFLGEKPIAAFEDMTALYRHYWDEAYL